MRQSTHARTVDPHVARGSLLPKPHLALLRQQLEEQRHFRLDQIEELAREAAVLTLDRDDARWQINRALTSAAHWALGDINAALCRLGHETYGICERCSQPISSERLEILPESRLCMTCQRREERMQSLS